MTSTKHRSQTWGDASRVDDRVTVSALDPGGRRLSRREQRRRQKRRSAFLPADAERVAEIAAAIAAGDPVPARKRTTPDLPPEELERQLAIAKGQNARAMPYRATLATVAAGTAAWGVGEFADLTVGAGASGVTSLFAGAAVAGGAAWWRVAKRKLFEPGWGRRYWAATACAATWTTTAGAVGPTWGVASALGVSALALGSRWMREHEVPHPADSPLAIEAGPPSPVDAFTARWHTRVAQQGGQVAEGRLSNGRETAVGLEYQLRVPPGMTVTAIRNRVDKIAAALGCDERQIVIDAVAADDKNWVDASRARLQFLHRSPIVGKTAVEHTGPVGGDGKLGIGPYVDGSGNATVTLADGSSVWSMFICGATGSGKTGVANGLVADARATLPIVTVYADPKRSSSPELAAAASVKALGAERMELFTSRVEVLVQGLTLRAAAEGEPSFQWGPGRPLYWLVLDEVPALFAMDGMAKRWEAIASQIRSLGVGILALGQEGDLPVFNGSNLLRNSICAGGVVLLRIPTGSSGQLVAPGLPNPSTIPMGGGYGHLAAPDSRPSVLFRARRLRSLKDCREEGLDPETTWNAQAAFEKYPDAPMCEVGRVAFGPLLEQGSSTSDRGAGQREEMAERLRRWKESGGEVDEREAVTVTVSTDLPFGPIPGPLLPPEPAPEPVDVPTGPVVPEGLTANQAAVWLALPARGTAPTADVTARSGLKPDAVGKVLPALARKGMAVSPKRGQWGRGTP